jgi:hypothetical protein
MTWLESNQAFCGLWAKALVFRIFAQGRLHYPKH